MRRLSNQGILAAIALIVVVVVGLQVWATRENARQVERILLELETIEPDELTTRKAREEVVALRVRNQLQAYFWQSLTTSLIPLAPALAVLVTAWFGLQKYLDARQKERADREEALEKERLEREKERLDRAGAELNEILKRLASKEARERLMGVVALQHFFSPDKAEYHLQALAALVAASEKEQPEELLRGLRVAADKAIRTLDGKLLREVSWQGVGLRGVDFSALRDPDRDLHGIDFRDADLEDAVFAGCNLTAARFSAARLKGANLERAVLEKADLHQGDLAGAKLCGARLAQADLHDVKVQDLDLEGADLRDARFDPAVFPWEMTRNWRAAELDADVRAALLRRYGPEPQGPRIVMLMWEVPPLVAGGTWTACHHLVRSLRRLGARLTVVVPWGRTWILPAPFGDEVEVVSLEMEPPLGIGSAYDGVSPGTWSPYGSGGSMPPWSSPYGRASTPSHAAGPYGPVWSSYGAPPAWSGYGRAGRQGLLLYRQGSTLLRLTEEFRRRVVHFCRKHEVEVIHAHDWVTFAAATAAAQDRRRPWVAHFHSTEAERRPFSADAVIERIEREAGERASHLVAPSRITARRLAERYGVAEARLTVVPNALSPDAVPVSEMGRFETKQVLFLGRLTPQKGLDRFAAIAEAVQARDPSITFVVHGEGEAAGGLQGIRGITLLGPLDWRRRGRAFRDASALLLTSRCEPFGMVVLEAMQHRVPAFFPEEAGVAEVIESGIRIRPEQTEQVATRLRGLLDDWVAWDRVVEEQAREVADYAERDDQRALLALWDRLLRESDAEAAGEGPAAPA